MNVDIEHDITWQNASKFKAENKSYYNIIYVVQSVKDSGNKEILQAPFKLAHRLWKKEKYRENEKIYGV